MQLRWGSFVPLPVGLRVLINFVVRQSKLVVVTDVHSGSCEVPLPCGQ